MERRPECRIGRRVLEAAQRAKLPNLVCPGVPDPIGDGEDPNAWELRGPEAGAPPDGVKARGRCAVPAWVGDLKDD